jgi:hypothetical protein
LLDRLKDYLDKEDGKEEGKRQVLSYNFGDIEKDGFLRLYPSNSFQGSICEQLDILVLSIPLGYGKYFGRYSPNWYQYKRLGHISFVSASFGVIETHPIEFGRVSLQVPSNAIGFFYNFGLDGIIRANASAVYTQIKEIE